MVFSRVTPTAIGICGPASGSSAVEPTFPRVERPCRIDRQHVAVARRPGLAAIDDRPELEMQRRLLRHGRDLGERLALEDEVANSDLHFGDVVVVGDEAEALGMMVDADVGRVAARLDLDLHDAPAVGRVHAVPSLGSEVDRLVQSVAEMDVAARWIRWIVGGDDLGRVARRRVRKLFAPQRVETSVLEARLQRQLQRRAEQPGLVGDRGERHSRASYHT